MKHTNFFYSILFVFMLCAVFCAKMAFCQSQAANNPGSVYYLNFKPESDAAWQRLAKLYSRKMGIKVKVETFANSTYTPTLKNKLLEKNAPTLFQLTPATLKELEKYCFNLKNTRVYNELNNQAYVLKGSYGRVCGIAYAVESYGLIVNRELLEKAGYDIDDIASFADLKKVAEDITSRSKDLGFAAFCSSGMDKSSDWRFKTHLANMPIYFEGQSKRADLLEKINGIYLDNLREIWDLYINNSTCSPKELASKSIEDARNEFLANKAVFYQNGSWEYVLLTKRNGGFNKYQLAMIPLFFNVGDESKQGLCTGTENYWCVNKESPVKDIKATLDFVNWCVTSEEGTRAMAQDMGLVIPFKNAAYSENIFIQQNAIYNAKGKTPVAWDFVTIPSERWKSELSLALTNYASNQSDANWQNVVAAFVNNWAKKNRG